VGDRARALIIFTDGEDTEGEAKAEVAKAVEAGIQTYLVGVGTKAGDRIPEFDEAGNEVGWKITADGKSYLTTKLDERSLAALAAAAGGPDRLYLADARRRGAGALIEELGKLKEGDLAQRVLKRYGEAYQWLLGPAFLALFIEAVLSDRRRRRASREEAERGHA
jgi:Ca-activated chloride channel family protein